VSVHIDVQPTMTGVSRFLELYPQWNYSRAEDLDPQTYTSSFSHLITADPPITYEPDYQVLDTIWALKKFQLNPISVWNPTIWSQKLGWHMIKAPKIFILERKQPSLSNMVTLSYEDLHSL
jgi:hypothetical protein